ncbi:hypothetical protein [Arthrobacter sp. RIT-PI-e]|uniref:hypothetical protein n=1 Tax=Arthrobacter sp. RIT-PI-e TaxID=1681197 RepID=UPI000AEFE1D8|nr:hypothetical protein [Arthrobacter sp. RIT-PI-e]
MRSAAVPVNLPALLHELEASGDWDVEEALFLTFNADVGFLERGILGLCQSMGARVTLIADAGMWQPDPLTMKGAGTQYRVGLASHSGAFHPKLALLIGSDRVLALIGSGNLTMGGWQHNSELWNVLRAEEGHAPHALVDLAAWLKSLSRSVRLGSDNSAALNRIGERLDAALEQFTLIHDGPRLVTNLDQSILSQLPGGPVDELTLYAPFIDEHASAVRALVRHFPTPKLTLVIQPGRTVVEPHALASVLRNQAGLTIITDTSPRYRHAKLVEWRRGSSREALTGSANLSAAAMLNTAHARGNVELGILTHLDEPLWPDPSLSPDHCAELVNITDIPTVHIGSLHSNIAEIAAPQLLSAMLSGSQLAIELAHPVSYDVELEYTNNPITDAWKSAGRIIAGLDAASFPAGQMNDSVLLRLNWMGTDQTTLARGPAVPASIPERLRVRPSGCRASTGLRIKSRDDLLGLDLRYLDAFSSQLAQIHEDVTALRSASGPRSVTPTTSAGDRGAAFGEAPAAWLWETEQNAQQLHGPAFSGFALGLPEPLPSAGWENFDSDETGELDADASLYVDEPVGAPPANDDEPAEPLAHFNDPEKIKKARRDRVRSFASMTARLSTTSYLGLARLTLCFYCAGNWEEHDPEPIGLITHFLSQALNQADSSSLSDEAHALAAVALTCIRHRTDNTTTSGATLEARRLQDRCGQLALEAVPLPLVTEYTRCLSAVGGRPLETVDVIDELERFLEHPQLDAVVMAAEGHGYEAEVLGPNTLQIAVRAREPVQAALRVLTVAQGQIGVTAMSTTSGKSAIAMWSDPDLYTIELADPERWIHHQSKQGLNVILAAIRDSEGGRFRVDHGPFNRAIPGAKQLAECLGLQIPAKSEVPSGVCPKCFLVLTPAGICANCEQ